MANKYFINKALLVTVLDGVRQLLPGEITPEDLVLRWEKTKRRNGETELQYRLKKDFIVDDEKKLSEVANPAVPSTTDKRSETLITKDVSSKDTQDSQEKKNGK